MRLREEVVSAEDSPHMTLLRITTFYCSLGVLAGGNACGTAQASRVLSIGMT